MTSSSRPILLAVVLAATLAGPSGLQAAPSDLYVSSSYPFAAPAFSVKRFDGTTGDPIGTAGTFATSDGLVFPRGLAFGPAGHLYVASETDNILEFNGAGAFIGEFIADGAGGEPFLDGLKAPKGIAFAPDGSFFAVSNGSPHRLLKFNGMTGAYLADLTATLGSTSFDVPYWGLAFGPDGNLYLSGGTTGGVLRFNPTTATFMDVFVPMGSGGLNNAHGLTFGPDDNLYVAGGDLDGRVWKFDGATGAFLGLFVATLDNGGMTRPDGLVFGPAGNLFVSSDTGKVLRFAGSDGHFLDVFAELEYPLGLGPAGLVFYPPLPDSRTGDFDADGDVDGADFLAWQNGFGIASGASRTQGDANADGDVDRFDLAVWKAQFGASGLASSTSSGVPEPSTVLLLIIAAAGCRLRSRGNAASVSRSRGA